MKSRVMEWFHVLFFRLVFDYRDLRSSFIRLYNFELVFAFCYYATENIFEDFVIRVLQGR